MGAQTAIKPYRGSMPSPLYSRRKKKFAFCYTLALQLCPHSQSLMCQKETVESSESDTSRCVGFLVPCYGLLFPPRCPQYTPGSFFSAGVSGERERDFFFCFCFFVFVLFWFFCFFFITVSRCGVEQEHNIGLIYILHSSPVIRCQWINFFLAFPFWTIM